MNRSARGPARAMLQADATGVARKNRHNPSVHPQPGRGVSFDQHSLVELSSGGLKRERLSGAVGPALHLEVSISWLHLAMRMASSGVGAERSKNPPLTLVLGRIRSGFRHVFTPATRMPFTNRSGAVSKLRSMPPCPADNAQRSSRCSVPGVLAQILLQHRYVLLHQLCATKSAKQPAGGVVADAHRYIFLPRPSAQSCSLASHCTSAEAFGPRARCEPRLPCGPRAITRRHSSTVAPFLADVRYHAGSRYSLANEPRVAILTPNLDRALLHLFIDLAIGAAATESV